MTLPLASSQTSGSKSLRETLKSPKRMLPYVLMAGFLARVAFGVFFVDLAEENYAEYGEIAKNIHAGNGYSLYHKVDSGIELWFGSTASPFPSAYMPPGYVFFLYPFLWIEDVPLRNLLILILQSMAGMIAVLLLYSLTKELFGIQAALVSAAIASFLPEFLYASSVFGPVVLFHLGVLLVFLSARRSQSLSHRHMVLLGLVVAAMVLLRSEFIVFTCVIGIVEWVRGNRRTVLITGGTVLVLLLPWTIRSSMELERFVPLTTNGGLNLYRGHNPVGIGAWADPALMARLAELEPGTDFEVRMQYVFLHQALEEIKANPWRAVRNGFEKLYHLWVVNPSDQRSFNPWYLYPWTGLLVLFIFAVWKSRSWSEHGTLYFFLLCSSMIAVVFFALPRYQTMMKIAVLPFAAHGFMLLRATIRPGSDPENNSR